MKRILLLGMTFCVALLAQAQRVYFIYLQSEDGRPFYVKMDNKVYSSAYSGYLLLSNLKDSSYRFSVGPVAKGTEEPAFDITVKGGDKGFLIKTFADYTGFFDLQTLQVIKPLPSQAKTAGGVSLAPRTDAFSMMLALSSGDSSLLYTQQALPKSGVSKNKEEKAVAPVESSPAADTSAEKAAWLKKQTVYDPEQVKQAELIATDSAQSKDLLQKALSGTVPSRTDSVSVIEAPVVTKDSVAAENNPEVYQKSAVQKRSESSTTEGFGLVFLDKHAGGTDTIRLLIPNPKYIFVPKTEAPQTAQDTTKNIGDTLQNIGAAPLSSRQKADAVQNTDPLSDSAAGTSIVSISTDTVKKAEPVAQNLSCKNAASDNDFFKLRKNMAAKDEDDEMIAEAKKFFKSRCFTTEQIRSLSALFLTSAGKYQFFDAAYLHVSDVQNFASLATEIKDDYNSKRFKALIGQ